MAEDQVYFGTEWNKKLNRFLSKVLGWQQLGTSGIDVFCESTQKKVGLDSVFAYRISARSPQQIVIVEAKTRAKMKAVTLSEMKDWIWDLIKKMECVSQSQDFMKKFRPAGDAEFGVGLVALWVRETDTFDGETIRQILPKIEVTSRKVPQHVFVIDNERIARLCSLYDEYNRLKASDMYEEVKFFIPPNSSEMICDGSVLPMEFLFSDWAFMTTRKKQLLKGTNQYRAYSSLACFYFGNVTSFEELNLIDLAIRDLGFGAVDDIDVYLAHPLDDIRSQIDEFKRGARFSVDFHLLPINKDLPGWLDSDE
jgi:hypothetical protein